MCKCNRAGCMSGPRVRTMKTRCRGRYMFDSAQFSTLEGRCGMRAAFTASSLGQSLGFGHLLHSAHGVGNEGSVLWE